MKTLALILLSVFFSIKLLASNECDSICIQQKGKLNPGVDSRNSQFFNERYLHNSFVHYLDNYTDFVTYQAETTGDFQTPDISLFSISGNSFRWNKFYLDNFRIDSRFFSGSNLYDVDLYSHSLFIDSYNTEIKFSTDDVIPNSVAVRYNIGGLGGISPLTEELVMLYHPTASQRLYKPIEVRRKMKQAGAVFANYTIPANGKNLKQQFSANFGTRMLVGFNFNGIDSYYPEDFVRIELNGELPLTIGKLFTKTNYLCSFLKRENLYTELNYARNESANSRTLNLSLYGSGNSFGANYTSGFTFSSNKISHQQLDFSRNLIDQDGEAFEPWYPDARIIEISHALNFKKKLAHNVEFSFDGYNSLIQFDPSEGNFSNVSYAQNVNLPYQSLYYYKWNSNSFTCGLLENVFQLKASRMLGSSLQMDLEADATFDGMLVSDKSVIKANWEGQLDFTYRPNAWFSMGLNLGKRRVAFNYDHIRYLSNDYMNGEIYYWNDINNNQQFEEAEVSDLLTTTGGKYHNLAPKLKQQQYFQFDFPIEFKFGNHKFSFQNIYKKYYNQWTTRFDKAAEDYGYFVPVGDQQIFYLNKGVVNYVVDYYPEGTMTSTNGESLFTNSPFYLASSMKYQYTTPKFYFSISWTSFMMAGISSMGNGPLHNNIDVFSETHANPNNRFKQVGRLDQDRALVARIFMSYQMSKQLRVALSLKFKDGQPFTNFNTNIVSAGNGNRQLAIWNNRVKGINPLDGEFGSRDDAFFNFEFRTTYSGKIKSTNYDLNLIVYNIYDFGTELVEYSFQPDNTTSRYAMEMNIPRGLMLTAKFYF